MDRGPTSRTEFLLRLYLCLLAVSVVLCAVLLQRHLPGFSGSGDAFMVVTPQGAPARRGYPPQINWGGAKL